MPANEPMPAVAVLAGGLATRLQPITATIPKSMVEVAGEPFIVHQLRLMVEQGVTEVVICTGHLAEQIESFVKDGARFGCRVRYSNDGAMPLGTGGALRRALPLLGRSFIVMYGDSYLVASFRALYDKFRTGHSPALMAVLRNDNRWDTSNVDFAEGMVRRYEKGNRAGTMRYIDYGLAVIDASVLRRWPENHRFDLAEVYADLVLRGLLAGYEVYERFYEIGSPRGLAETESFLRGVRSVRHETKRQYR